MKNRTKLVSLLILLLVGSPMLFSGLLVAGDNLDITTFATPEDFEENMFLPAFDMYINYTASLLYRQGWSTQEQAQGWKIVRTVFIPNSAIDNWQVLDKSARIASGHYFSAQAGTTDNDLGYLVFADAVADLVLEFDQFDLADSKATNIDVNKDYLDDTSAPTATNITTFDSDPVSGIEYIATDGKSIEEYAEDEATKLGGSLNNVVNATALGFSYSDLYDQLVAVNCNFDTETATMLSVDPDNPETPQYNGIIQRVRIWLHNRKVQRSNYGFTGTKYTIQDTLFKDIKLAGASLPGIPTGAKYYFSKTIGSAFWKKPFSVGALGSGLLQSAVGKLLAFIMSILTLLIAVFVVIWLVKKFKRKRR